MSVTKIMFYHILHAFSLFPSVPGMSVCLACSSIASPLLAKQARSNIQVLVCMQLNMHVHVHVCSRYTTRTRLTRSRNPTPAPGNFRIESEENPRVRCGASVMKRCVHASMKNPSCFVPRSSPIDGTASTPTPTATAIVDTYLTESIQDTHLGDFLDGSYFFGIRHGIGLFGC